MYALAVIPWAGFAAWQAVVTAAPCDCPPDKPFDRLLTTKGRRVLMVTRPCIPYACCTAGPGTTSSLASFLCSAHVTCIMQQARLPDGSFSGLFWSGISSGRRLGACCIHVPLIARPLWGSSQCIDPGVVNSRGIRHPRPTRVFTAVARLSACSLITCLWE